MGTVTIDAAGGTYQLGGNLTMGASRTLILTNGTFDANGFDVTISHSVAFDSNNTNTRTLKLGSGTWTFSASGNSLVTVNGLNLTTDLTGANPWQMTHSGSTAMDIDWSNASESNVVDFDFTSGTYTATIQAARNIDFTGFAGSLGAETRVIYGSLTLSSGMSLAASTGSTTFASTSTGKTVTTQGKTFDFPVVFDGVGGGWTLVGDLVLGSTRALALNNGALDMGGNDITCQLFATSGTGVRSLTSGGGSITVTGNATTVLSGGITTNLTLGDVVTIISNYSGATGTRTFQWSTGTAESNSPNLLITAGTDIVDIAAAARDIDFTGFAGTLNSDSRTIYGNFTYSTGMTPTAGSGTNTFAATSGTQVITTNGLTFAGNITLNGAGGTVQLADNLTGSSARTLTVTRGTLDLNDKDVSFGLLSSSNSNVRAIDFGSGTFTVTGTGTVININTSSNLTITPGTSTIAVNDASATTKTMAFGNKTYNNLLLTGAGTGVFAITTGGTFNDFACDTPPHTIRFTASTTTTVTTFSVNGTAGNLITLESASLGSNYNLIKAGGGQVTCSYLSVSDSSASPNGDWIADDGTSTDGGGNSGWVFSGGVVAVQGVAGTSAVNNVAIVGDVLLAITGVSGMSAVGTGSVVGKASVPTTGIFASAVLGQAIAPFETVFLTGEVASASLGDVDASGGAGVQLTGIFATTSLGTVTTRYDFIFAVTGVSAAGQTGFVSVWGVIIPSQNAGWSAVSPAQTPGWSPVDPSQSPSWTDI